MKRYTKDGVTFYKKGDKVDGHYCVSENWLMKNGYLPYEERREDGTDGNVGGAWVHYLGAPYVAPVAEVAEPTEEEIAAQKEAERVANINAQIDALKQQLADSDYKVIKNMESESCGGQYEYDPAELHSERQAIRDQINQLQESLTNKE